MKRVNKYILFSLVLGVCSVQSFASNLNENLVKRNPSSFEETLMKRDLTNSELMKTAGKNILRVTVACPVSAYTIIASAVAETFPITSSFAGTITDETSDGKFDFFNDKTTATATLGTFAGIIKDLTAYAYALIFVDSPSFEGGIFKDTKTSYNGTAYLAKHFYSEQGECGKAGRALVDTLEEVQSRKK